MKPIMLLILGVVACGNVEPRSMAPRCTSAVHCAGDEVCFTYNVTPNPMVGERGPKPWREGYCGKL